MLPADNDPQHDRFRTNARAAADLIADYWSSLRGDQPPPVQTSANPGDVLALLPESPPEQGEPLQELLDDVRRIVLPNVTHWQHPGFFGYFPCNGSPPAVIADLISAGLGVQGMLWSTSPACTELETRVCDWMCAALGLPSAFLSTSPDGGGVIQGTASESTLVALLAARDRLRRAAPSAVPVLYCSTQAHSSVLKAAMIAGVAEADGKPRVRQVTARSDWGMDADALAAALRADLASGLHPAMVCATLGTTGVMAFDDLAAVGRAIDSCGAPHHVWLHADAAMAGAAFIRPELRGPLAGAERLDSLCFNPHKWLLTSFDCGLFWTRRRSALVNALSVTPEYLRNAASSAGGVIDYRDWQVPLGRRFRSLKLWFVMRAYGLEGLRNYVGGHLRLAGWVEGQASDDERWGVCAPRHPASPLVCLTLRGERGTPSAAESLNAHTRAAMERANASGAAWFSHTTLPDERPGFPPLYVVRFAIGGTYTQREHVERGWQALRDAS